MFRPRRKPHFKFRLNSGINQADRDLIITGFGNKIIKAINNLDETKAERLFKHAHFEKFDDEISELLLLHYLDAGIKNEQALLAIKLLKDKVDFNNELEYQFDFQQFETLSPLGIIIRNGGDDLTVFNALIEAGANINHKLYDDNGDAFRVLSLAIKYGQLTFVKALLDKGAKVDFSCIDALKKLPDSEIKRNIERAIKRNIKDQLKYQPKLFRVSKELAYELSEERAYELSEERAMESAMIAASFKK